MSGRDWWECGDFFGAGFGPRFWAFGAPGMRRGGGPRRRQVFESGEMKFVILRLLKEKPRHGYEVIKALEEQLGGWYTPSPGTVYPTLQLLEDQGYVRIEESEGKKVYHITVEGEKFLEEHHTTLDDILDRVREAVHGVAGGAMREFHRGFADLARTAYGKAMRAGPDSDVTRKVTEILRKTAQEIGAL